MNKSASILEQAATDPRELARKAVGDAGIVGAIIQGLEAREARGKYGCAKALRYISETHPELLYDQFDFFVGLLGNENKVLQWDALRVLSHLARVDSDNKVTANFDKYCSSIPGPVMITAANAIQGCARMAKAKPELADRFAQEILKAGRGRYQKAECRNVAIGHAIAALEEIVEFLKNRAPVVSFVKRQMRNPRSSTRRKAERFLIAIHALARHRKPGSHLKP